MQDGMSGIAHGSAIGMAEVGLNGLRASELNGLDRYANTKENLDEAAKQFEAVLLKQVVQALRATVPDGGMGSSGAGSNVYDHFIEDALTGAISDGGGIGLASLFGTPTQGDLAMALHRPHDLARTADVGRPVAPATPEPPTVNVMALEEAPAPRSDVQTTAPRRTATEARALEAYGQRSERQTPADPGPPPTLFVAEPSQQGLDDSTTPLFEMLPPTDDPWLGREDAREILQHLMAAPSQ